MDVRVLVGFHTKKIQSEGTVVVEVEDGIYRVRVCPLKRDYFNREIHLNQPLIFRGHVSFQGCISFCLALCFWISELLITWMVVRCNLGPL